MKLLLDTHFAVWLTLGGENLIVPERRLIVANAADLTVSAVSIWELRLKWHSFHASGARKGPADPADVLAAMIGSGCAILPITADHVATVLEVPLDHGDLFDELLLVQAQVEGLRLLTRDRAMAGHPLVVRDADPSMTRLR